MRKETLLLLIGFLVFITPFLGVPQSWKAPYLFVLGGVTVIFSFSYRLAVRRKERSMSDSSFIEHNPTVEAVSGEIAE